MNIFKTKIEIKKPSKNQYPNVNYSEVYNFYVILFKR